MKRLFAALAVFVFIMPASAQELPWTLDCLEVIHAEANDDLDSYNVKKDRNFHLTFSRQSEDEWIMVGNLGSVPVVAIPKNTAVYLVETTPAGAINLTQISTASDDGVFAAVHSRHTVILGALAPSQYLLSCTGR
jgi:hypothetical protein